MSENEHLVALDETDRGLLNRIQTDFPIDSRPYRVLAQQFGLTEDQVIERIERLRESGVIRRIGGNFPAKKMGYISTLCAARVPEDKFDNFVKEVNKYTGVTHNYRRSHDINVWFTFIAPSMEEIEKNLADITRSTGVDEIYNLPADKLFKIRVDFRFDE